MRDSLRFRGSALWSLVNCNDKIDMPYFKEIKRLLTTKDYFVNFLFDGTSASEYNSI